MNIGLLVIFKYAGFLVQCFNAVTHLSVPVPGIRLPIGISFYTFQAMSYVIDVYRSKKSEEGVSADSTLEKNADSPVKVSSEDAGGQSKYISSRADSENASGKNRDSEVKADRSFLRVLLYISFFPQLIAGPIVKYHDIAVYLTDRNKDPEQIHAGIRRFIIGLSKKVLIANVMAQAADTLFNAKASGIGAALAGIGSVS